ncbi:MAG: 50S ribosomal protein L4 [Planctomycetes bacterium]|nr:50S ribosomal protein L4 [Planctomycetota bacterium]
MAQMKYFRFADSKVETLEIDEHTFGVRSPRRVQREAVLMYLANRRVGTHDTLTRAEVNGSIKKPWKQKHTGRARAGRKTSPLWRGGGVIFGPHPRDYSYALPRKELRVATRAALAGKLRDGEVIFVDAIDAKIPKTKTMAKMFVALGIERTCLLVLPERDENVFKSVRNLPGASVKTADEVNAYDILSHRTVLMTPSSFEMLKVRVAAKARTGSPA